MSLQVYLSPDRHIKIKGQQKHQIDKTKSQQKQLLKDAASTGVVNDEDD